VVLSPTACNATLAGATATFACGPVAPGQTLSLDLALVAGPNATATLATGAALAAGFGAAWDGFAAGWAARWADAFTPKSVTYAGHFSGSLPVVRLEATPAGAALERMYYVSAYTLLAHERTNLPLLYPRV